MVDINNDNAMTVEVSFMCTADTWGTARDLMASLLFFFYFCGVKSGNYSCNLLSHSKIEQSSQCYVLLFAYFLISTSIHSKASLFPSSSPPPPTLSILLFSFTTVCRKMTSIGFLNPFPSSSFLGSTPNSHRSALCRTHCRPTAPAVRMMADDKPKNPLSGLGMPQSSPFPLT